MTRGERNNNPGNIRKSGQRFLGEICPSNDKAFKEFRSMDYGYRALEVILQTYNRKYGLNTVRTLIGRWAPGNENDTGAYIRRVCADTGYGADVPIDVLSKDVSVKLARAISKVECAGWHDTSAAMRGFDLI
jgi:hypothetical protein